jgi:muramoyltetrapeptide carboxypeptidase
LKEKSKKYMNRRSFIQKSTLAAAVLPANLSFTNDEFIKSQALQKGDTVGFICPAAPAFDSEIVNMGIEALQKMGLKVRLGKHVFDRYGYLAGKDEDRASDINAMFADPSIKAIMAIHGGWGCARLLPLLDYELIRSNPKIFIGYSDITALLLGIHQHSKLITFHGNVGSGTFNSFTTGYLEKTLFQTEAFTMTNPVEKGDNLVVSKDRIFTIQSGKAQGRLVGGNLTVLSHLIGTPHLPSFDKAILFLEDVNEEVYKIDRMLTQLKLAGLMQNIAGFVFGKCTDCNPSKGGFGSLTIEDLWNDHIKPYNIPAFAGAMIGHIPQKFTIPIGIMAEIDADAGSIRLLESAVS